MRTVGARLKLDVLSYVRGAREAKDATKGIEDKLNDAAKAGDKTAKAAADIGRVGPRALKLTERAASELDRQIDETRKSYEKLRDQFERSGDLDVFEAMGRELAKLDKQLDRRRVIFGDSDDDSKKRGLRMGANMAEGIAAGLSRAGGPISAALSNVFGTLPPQAQAAIGGSLIAAVAMAAPAVGATISGAALAGIGSGALAVGVAAAFQDPRVKAAAQGLGAQVKQTFAEVGQDFGGDTVAAIRRIRSELNRIGLREALAPAAGLLRPLTEGLLGLARNAMPGLRAAIASARQPIEAISAALPRLGTAVGSLLEMFARHAESGAAALTMLFDVVVVGVKLVEMQIGVLIAAFEALDKLPIPMTGVIGAWIEESKGATAASGEWNTALDALKPALAGVAGATGAANAAAIAYADTIRAQTDPSYALITAQKNLATAQREYNEAIKEHGRNSPEAREKLLALGQAAIAAQIAAQGAAGSFDGKLTPSMRATLRAANLTEAEINDLERQFREAKRAGDAMAKTYRAKMVFETIGRPFSDYTGIGGSTTRGYSRGGMIEGPGPRGRDSVPIIGAPGEGVLNLRGMAAIGGERTLNALNAGSVTPTWDAPTWSAPDWSAYRPMAAAGSQRVEVVARFVGPPGTAGDIGAALSRFIQLDVWDRGSGDVQRAYGKRG